MTGSESRVVAPLRAESITLGYENKTISTDLSLVIPEQKFTAIIGPNGCGKSTLLRGLARLIKPTQGTILLNGTDLLTLPSRAIALQLGLLPQSATAPDGITVYDLVARGRFPHQTMLRQWSDSDATAVTQAMAATGVETLATQLVDELSGGQRQRVWIAMALAQDTSILLLDEPTTFLDIAHQVDLLSLLHGLTKNGDRTLVAVLHELNLAARYADQLVVMCGGEIYAIGKPAEVITEQMMQEVFGLQCRIMPDPETGTPLTIPRVK